MIVVLSCPWVLGSGASDTRVSMQTLRGVKREWLQGELLSLPLSLPPPFLVRPQRGNTFSPSNGPSWPRPDHSPAPQHAPTAVCRPAAFRQTQTRIFPHLEWISRLSRVTEHPPNRSDGQRPTRAGRDGVHRHTCPHPHQHPHPHTPCTQIPLADEPNPPSRRDNRSCLTSTLHPGHRSLGASMIHQRTGPHVPSRPQSPKHR